MSIAKCFPSLRSVAFYRQVKYNLGKLKISIPLTNLFGWESIHKLGKIVMQAFQVELQISNFGIHDYVPKGTGNYSVPFHVV